MNIIFIGAHPDDLEILCAGTIARCAAEGHNVTMAVATNGCMGSRLQGKAETAALRKEEALAASRVLGAKDFIWIDEEDEFLFDDRTARLKVIDAVRKAKADVIITHNPADYHTDHLSCSKLGTDARILAAVRLIETEHPHLENTPELFYMDSIAGVNVLPTFHVDITSFIETKMRALACHDSQNDWLRSLFKQDLSDIARTQSAFRGLQCAVPFAEGFLQPHYWPKKAVSLPFL